MRTRKLSLQSEMDSLILNNFIACYQIGNKRECLCHIFEYTNMTTLHFLCGLHTEQEKIRYLRNSALGKKNETTPLKNIFPAQYIFDQLFIALKEGI